jgi:DNA-directed RNA polymerase II subunit RPB7
MLLLQVKIQKECEVRLKIIGTRVDATAIFCVGTIKDDFLGVINDPAAA